MKIQNKVCFTVATFILFTFTSCAGFINEKMGYTTPELLEFDKTKNNGDGWSYDGESGILTICNHNGFRRTEDWQNFWEATGENFWVKEIIFEEGITEIPDNIFHDFQELEKISLPTTVTSIGSNAFLNNSIVYLVIPANVTTICYGAFERKETIQGEIKLDWTKSEATYHTIEDGAFKNIQSVHYSNGETFNEYS